MIKKDFYTANGWAGSNYECDLSIKEIAAKVRAFAKQNFQDFKFSVRSELSIYTDLLYIELKEGTCIPFVEGSRSAERGYMSTMTTVRGWEKDLTPDVFKALDAVSTYANSFRYDDSDGMQDYYDTNFYLSINVGDAYKVVKPKTKENGVKSEKIEGVQVVDYSEKAVAVFGDTKAIKEQLKKLGGRFNPSLNYNGEKRAGWIFSKKQADKVKELITPTELPALPEEICIAELAKETGRQEIAGEVLPVENVHLARTDLPLHCTPMAEGVEFYERKVRGKRYTVKDKPLNLGYYGIIDNLDNCMIECCPTKEEAEKEAEILNGLTDGNGRLKRAI